MNDEGDILRLLSGSDWVSAKDAYKTILATAKDKGFDARYGCGSGVVRGAQGGVVLVKSGKYATI